MAVSEGVHNACDSTIRIDDANGIPVDVSGSGNEFTLEVEQEAGEYRVFGNKFVKRLVCGVDGSLRLSFVYEIGANTGWQLLRAWWANATYRSQARTIRIILPEDDSGADDYEGEFFLQKLSFGGNAEEAGPMMVSADFLPNGEIAFRTTTS